MRFAKIWMCAISIMAMQNLATAAPVLFEPFNYMPADPVTTAALINHAGWTSFSGTSETLWLTNTGSLTYPNYPAPADPTIALLTPSRQEDAATAFDSSQTFNTGAIYYSTLVRLTGIPATGGAYFMFFKPDVYHTFNFYGRLWVKQVDSTNFQFGLTASTTNSAANVAPVYTSTNYQLNNVYHVIVKFEMNGGASNDVASMYIDPVPGAAEPGSPDLTQTNSPDATVDPDSIGAIAIRQASGIGSVNVDDIRVGTTYADVNPSNAAVSNWTIY